MLSCGTEYLPLMCNIPRADSPVSACATSLGLIVQCLPELLLDNNLISLRDALFSLELLSTQILGLFLRFAQYPPA